jgi:hypothetical protein
MIIGVDMAPRGEVTMVIALLALNRGIIEQPACVAMVLMSLVNYPDRSDSASQVAVQEPLTSNISAGNSQLRLIAARYHQRAKTLSDAVRQTGCKFPGAMLNCLACYRNNASGENPSPSSISRSRFRASTWICRTRSRVTPISLPTSSSVEIL